jgi:hypothetical protein
MLEYSLDSTHIYKTGQSDSVRLDDIVHYMHRSSLPRRFDAVLMICHAEKIKLNFCHACITDEDPNIWGGLKNRPFLYIMPRHGEMFVVILWSIIFTAISICKKKLFEQCNR